MAWYRKTCKLVIYFSISVLAFVILRVFLFPIIVDYIWRVPESPSNSLKAIIARRIELQNLERQLNQALHASAHPINEVLIPEMNAIVKKYDIHIAEMEDYTSNYGNFKVSDLETFINSHGEISAGLDTFVRKYDELKQKRDAFLMDLARQVFENAESTKTALLLSKQMKIMAGYGIILDLAQEEPQNNQDDDFAREKLAAQSVEDEASIAAMQKLLQLMTKADSLSERMMLKITQLNEHLTQESLVDNDRDPVDVEQELQYFQEESVRLKKGMVQLYKTKRDLLGKVGFFITEASERVKALANEFIHKENYVWMEEITVLLRELKDKSAKSTSLTEKLTSNVVIRIAPDLDKKEL